MNNARANFAALVMDNLLYVYGGITMSHDHKAALVDIVVERFDPDMNSW